MWPIRRVGHRPCCSWWADGRAGWHAGVRVRAVGARADERAADGRSTHLADLRSPHADGGGGPSYREHNYFRRRDRNKRKRRKSFVRRGGRATTKATMRSPVAFGEVVLIRCDEPESRRLTGGTIEKSLFICFASQREDDLHRVLI